MECKMGNVLDSSIRFVWFGKQYEKVRERFKKNRIPFLSCLDCPGFKISRKENLVFDKANFPWNVYIETTAFCNLHCYICRRERINKDRKGKMFLNHNEMNRILNEIISYKEFVRCINWFGYGEPFMNKNLISYIQKVKSEAPEIKHNISTNGLLLDSDNKIRDLLSVEVDRITFSIDGATDKTYLKYHVGGNFAKALSNMKNLVKLRNDQGYLKPIICWQYIFFKWNDSRVEIERARKLAKDIGVDQLIFMSTFSPFFFISWRYPPFARAKLRKLNAKYVHSME